MEAAETQSTAVTEQAKEQLTGVMDDEEIKITSFKKQQEGLFSDDK